MNFRKIKKITFALILALGFASASGLSDLSIIQAQHPQSRHQKMSGQEQTAYRDGYRMGRNDARVGRRYDYNNSRLYRRGSRDYREDFRRGYKQGYRRG